MPSEQHQRLSSASSSLSNTSFSDCLDIPLGNFELQRELSSFGYRLTAILNYPGESYVRMQRLTPELMMSKTKIVSIPAEFERTVDLMYRELGLERSLRTHNVAAQHTSECNSGAPLRSEILSQRARCERIVIRSDCNPEHLINTIEERFERGAKHLELSLDTRSVTVFEFSMLLVNYGFSLAGIELRQDGDRLLLQKCHDGLQSKVLGAELLNSPLKLVRNLAAQQLLRR